MIRPIRYEDIPGILALAAEMHREGVYAPYDFNPRKLAQHIANFVDSESRAGFVFEKDSSIEGAIFGYLDTHYFGNSGLAVQNGYFISKKSRGGTAAVRLIRAFEDWASKFEIECIVFTTSNNGKDDRWLRFCEALGYQQVGYVFHKRV